MADLKWGLTADAPRRFAGDEERQIKDRLMRIRTGVRDLTVNGFPLGGVLADMALSELAYEGEEHRKNALILTVLAGMEKFGDAIRVSGRPPP